MESELLTGLMSILTATAGFLGAPLDQGSHDNHQHNHMNSGDHLDQDFEFGTAHEHAQFFLNVDGEEINFTQRKYQLQSKYVHLENFKPHIVHKHSQNVTWSHFLGTIDVEISRGENESCINFKGQRECGNLSTVLNGEESNLSEEIQQGDNLAILLDADNMTEEYMSEEIPEAYTKDAVTRGV